MRFPKNDRNGRSEPVVTGHHQAAAQANEIAGGPWAASSAPQASQRSAGANEARSWLRVDTGSFAFGEVGGISSAMTIGRMSGLGGQDAPRPGAIIDGTTSGMDTFAPIVENP
jgi:hypothetical protein